MPTMEKTSSVYTSYFVRWFLLHLLISRSALKNSARAACTSRGVINELRTIFYVWFSNQKERERDGKCRTMCVVLDAPAPLSPCGETFFQWKGHQPITPKNLALQLLLPTPTFASAPCPCGSASGC